MTLPAHACSGFIALARGDQPRVTLTTGTGTRHRRGKESALRVLITGGRGFIGSRVAALAHARGHDVYLLGRTPSPDAKWPLVVHDLAKYEGLDVALRGVEAVVHCAASMGIGAEEQLASTVTGTRNLVAAMGAASVKRIVLVSSFAVYDYTALRPGDVLTEDAPLDMDGHARGPYVSAKREQEQIVTGASGGIQWTILRPGLVFGPGRTWFYHLGMQLSRRAWVSLAGDGLLPLTHVENCASAIVAALDEPRSTGTTLNVVDDDLPTRRTYLDWLRARQAPKPVVIDVPWSALNGASRSAWMAAHGVLRDLVAPPGLLHPAVLAARCKPLRYDNARLRRVLSWAPRITVKDGLDAALDEGAHHGAG